MGRGRKHITLLEVLLVMGLLALTFSVVGIQIPRALKGEKFQKSVSRTLDALTLAQEKMLNLKTDESVLIQKNGSIKEIKWNGEPVESVKLHFLASSEWISKGELTLVGEGKETTLVLPGYPARIVRREYATSPSAPEARPPQLPAA